MNNVTNDSIYEELINYLDNIAVIDTHEHLPGSDAKRKKVSDVLCEYVPQYFGRDLVSAGLRSKDFSLLLSSDLSVGKKWDILEPYWRYCRYTGYGMVLEKAVKGLYDIDGISRSTIGTLNERFLDSYTQSKCQTVLREKCGIITAVIDTDLDCDPDYFRSAFNIDFMVMPETQSDIELIDTQLGRKVSCLDDWLEGCCQIIREAVSKGAVAFKNSLAYQRSLYFDRTTFSDAQRDFGRLVKFRRIPEWKVSHLDAGKAFGNYIMHYLLSLIEKCGLPLQVHTGYQEGNGNCLADANPILLNNLFLEYPGVRFDVFHMGYPYQKEAQALCKMFPNVYMDMCWANALAPQQAAEMLSECIETVPLNKISAFGGDYEFFDGVFGHLLLAKHNVALALAQSLKNGRFDMEEAKWIAKRLFYHNPAELFNLTSLPG